MARPKKWFENNELVGAKKATKDRHSRLWKYSFKGKGGKKGYYVGENIPGSLANARVEWIALT